MMSDNAGDIAMQTLRGLGWAWTELGPVVTVATNTGTHRVLVPIQRTWVSFGKELPFPAGVGCPQTVGGLFSSIKKAARGVVRGIKRRVKRVGRIARRFVPKKIRKAAGRVARFAKRVATSKLAQAAVTGLGVAVPVLAPAAASVVAAQRIIGQVDDARKTALAVSRGVRATPRMLSSMLRGKSATRQLSAIMAAARSGDPRAQRIVGAMGAFAA